MATNQTEHYGLSQWEPEDSFLREEFNEDFRKIDAALTAKCEVVTGTVAGNGDWTHTVELGFQPKALIYEDSQGVRGGSNLWGGLALPGHPALWASESITVTETGFTTVGQYLNAKGRTYHYLAFR